MKRVLIGLLLVSACGRMDGESAEAVHTDVAATVDYSLPADGCDWTVVIDGVSYRPDEDSLPDVQAVSPGRPVRVDYRPTGRTVTIVCGWNTHKDVAEITVLSIDETL